MSEPTNAASGTRSLMDRPNVTSSATIPPTSTYVKARGDPAPAHTARRRRPEHQAATPPSAPKPRTGHMVTHRPQAERPQAAAQKSEQAQVRHHVEQHLRNGDDLDGEPVDVGGAVDGERDLSGAGHEVERCEHAHLAQAAEDLLQVRVDAVHGQEPAPAPPCTRRWMRRSRR